MQAKIFAIRGALVILMGVYTTKQSPYDIQSKAVIAHILVKKMDWFRNLTRMKIEHASN